MIHFVKTKPSITDTQWERIITLYCDYRMYTVYEKKKPQEANQREVSFGVQYIF